MITDVSEHNLKEYLKQARKFCYEVGILAKKYNLPVFVVTDGASLTKNNNNSVVKFHREKQIEWEISNGFNPLEQWDINDI